LPNDFTDKGFILPCTNEDIQNTPDKRGMRENSAKKQGRRHNNSSALSHIDSTSACKPFLKWPGGKRWLVENYKHLLPTAIKGRYIEPFLGGGAVFFALQPKEALLSDLCDDLIAVYRGIRNQPSQVARFLESHAVSHNTEYYYRIRDEEPRLIAERAARILYLNRACFNGIYRVNRQGKFNVPIGTRQNILRNDDFNKLSRVLGQSTIKLSDFEPIIEDARKGDFVFVDPPYTVKHNSNGFIKYNEILFSWDDQRRLHDCLVKARSRGVSILMTNANHYSVRELYKKGFTQTVVSRFSSIAASSGDRDRYEELVIQC